MKKSWVMLAASLAVVFLGAAGCPKTEYKIENIHPAWVEDGPGGTVPTPCPAGSGQVALALRPYTVSDTGERTQVNDIQTKCVDADTAKKYQVGDVYP